MTVRAPLGIGEEVETVGQSCGQIDRVHGTQPWRGELRREGQPIETSADVRRGGPLVLGVDIEVGVARPGPGR